MMGTTTGLVRTSRLGEVNIDVVCGALGRIELMECKVVEDDVRIERVLLLMMVPTMQRF